MLRSMGIQGLRCLDNASLSVILENDLVWIECLCPAKIHMLKPKFQYVGIRRWDLWEVNAS